MYTGLDISLTATGVANISNNGKITSKILSAPKPKKFNNKFNRYQSLVEDILDYIKDTKTKYVVLEDYIVTKHSTTTTKLIEVGACVRYTMNLKKIPFLTVAGSQLKKYVCGKGNVPKDILIKELYKRYDVDVFDNNEADAIGLAMICRDLVKDKPQQDVKYMKEVLAKIRKDRERFNWSL